MFHQQLFWNGAEYDMKNYADWGGRGWGEGSAGWIWIKYIFFSFLWQACFFFRILMQQQSPYQTTSVMYNAFKNLPVLEDL